MDFAFFWVFELMATLLWVAFLSAWIMRLRTVAGRIVLSILTVLVPLIPLCVAAYGALCLRAKVQRNWYGYTVSFTFCFIFGTALILVWAWRARKSGRLAPIRHCWMLSAAWLAAVVLAAFTIHHIDLRVRNQCAAARDDMQREFVANMPPAVPDDQNAALVYEKAFVLLEAHPPEFVHNPPVGDEEKFTPFERHTLDYLKAQTPTIALLRQAAALPACRFEEDVTAVGFEADTTYLNRERDAASLLALHAKQSVAAGDVAGAIEDVNAAFAMARHIAPRSKLINALVTIGVETVADNALQDILPNVKRPQDLAALHLNDPADMNARLIESLRGEERFGLDLYAQVLSADGNMGKGSNLPASGVIGPIGRVFILGDIDDYVHLLEQMRENAAHPYFEISDTVAGDSEPPYKGGVMVSILSPFSGLALDRVSRSVASDADAKVAVAMTRFRLDHGSLPFSISELVPAYLNAVPVDPFDGRPLKLAIKDDARIIYSVGPDGMDDGGAEMKPGAKGDVIFTLRATSTTKPFPETKQ